MQTLPGRLGNLTAEQEEKLFELWKLMLQICAVEDEAAAEPAPDDAGGALQTRTLTADDDPEDKYGHNKVFRETLASTDPGSIRDALWTMVKMDHPDQLLLRFLRARKWDIQKALVMFISTLKWRQDMKVDEDIMLNGEEYFSLQEQRETDEKKKTFASDFLAQMRLGKSFAHGIDKEGRPITVVRVRLHRAGEQSQESLERYTVYLIETARLLLTPPADTGTVVFDMTGFSMANMDYAPVKFMIQCFEANYPESLGIVLVHKAPWIFQGIWKVIQRWLDPVVASKIHFTNNAKDMSEFITLTKIPKELDGGDPWEYQFVEPVIGENPKMKDTATRDTLQEERESLYEEFEQKTLQRLKERDAEKRAAIRADRDAIAAKLKAGYWVLDPYVRMRSLYDRVGIILPDGKINYDSWNTSTPLTNGTQAAIASSPAVIETASDDVD
ncbi:CRAL-TRIO domain-containing protein [Xylariales sp. PMI_506]|nr:CRAL-TRIO domain-containing protein [Xylariales sp. PMI_506]